MTDHLKQPPSPTGDHDHWFRRLLKSPGTVLVFLATAIGGVAWDAIRRATEPRADAAVRGIGSFLRLQIDLWVVLLVLCVAGWAIWVAFDARRSFALAAKRFQEAAIEMATETENAHGAEAVDKRRCWPGRQLHGSLDSRSSWRWERIFDRLDIEWRVLHLHGHIVDGLSPQCPRCHDDMKLIQASEDGGEVTEAVCHNETCLFKTTIPENIATILAKVGASIGGELRRESRS